MALLTPQEWWTPLGRPDRALAMQVPADWAACIPVEFQEFLLARVAEEG